MIIPQVDNFERKERARISTFKGLHPGFQIERNTESKLLDFGVKPNTYASKKLIRSEIVRAAEPVALILNVLSDFKILDENKCFVRAVTSRRDAESIHILLPEYEWLKHEIDHSPIIRMKVFAQQAILFSNRRNKTTSTSAKDLQDYFNKHTYEVLGSRDPETIGNYYIYRFAFNDKYDDTFYVKLAKSGIDLDIGLGLLAVGDYTVEDFKTIAESPKDQVRSIIASSF